MNNLVIIRGALGRDPELKYTAAGKAYMLFSLAVPREKKNKDGNSSSDWLDCIAWGVVAEETGLQAQKGSVLCVIGELQTNNWTDKNNNKRKTVQVYAKNIYVLTNYHVEGKDIIPSTSLHPKNPQTPASNTGGYVDELDATIGTDDFPFF